LVWFVLIEERAHFFNGSLRAAQLAHPSKYLIRELIN